MKSFKGFFVLFVGVLMTSVSPLAANAQDGGFGHQLGRVLKNSIPGVEVMGSPITLHPRGSNTVAEQNAPSQQSEVRGGFGRANTENPAEDVPAQTSAPQSEIRGGFGSTNIENPGENVPAAMPTQTSVAMPDPESHITHYDSDGGGKEGEMPNLAGVLVGIRFTGSVADKLIRQLRQLGVNDFSDICPLPGKAVVCFDYEESVKGSRVDNSGSSYGNGQRGARGNTYWGYSSQNGEYHNLIISVDLYDPKGKAIPLSKTFRYAFVGNSSSSSSNSDYRYDSNRNNNFGGTYNSNVTTPEAIAYGNAVLDAVNHLLDKGRGRKGKTHGWYPGAAEAVANAFNKPVVISRR